MNYLDKRTPLESRVKELESQDKRGERHHLESKIVEGYNSPVPDHYLIEE